MSYRVLYAPHPPEFALDLSAEQFARLDARFADLRLLQVRGALGTAVQDSADLLGAHLTLREAGAEWCGTPGSPAGLGACCPVAPLPGWSEGALEHGLALDLGRPRVRGVDPARLAREVLAWPLGTVYLFGGEGETAVPVPTRRLNLTDFLDRLEVEFLAGAAFGGRVVRAHRLAADGTHEVWRAAGRPGECSFPP